jgi:hypothetical protein
MLKPVVEVLHASGGDDVTATVIGDPVTELKNTSSASVKYDGKMLPATGRDVLPFVAWGAALFSVGCILLLGLLIWKS